MKEPPDTNIQVVYHDSDTNTEYVSAAYSSPSLRAIYSHVHVFNGSYERERERERDAVTPSRSILRTSKAKPREEDRRFDRLTFLEAFFFEMSLLYH